MRNYLPRPFQCPLNNAHCWSTVLHCLSRRRARPCTGSSTIIRAFLSSREVFFFGEMGSTNPPDDRSHEACQRCGILDGTCIVSGSEHPWAHLLSRHYWGMSTSAAFSRWHSRPMVPVLYRARMIKKSVECFIRCRGLFATAGTHGLGHVSGVLP